MTSVVWPLGMFWCTAVADCLIDWIPALRRNDALFGLFGKLRLSTTSVLSSRKFYSCDRSAAGSERKALTLGCHPDRVQRAEGSHPRLSSRPSATSGGISSQKPPHTAQNHEISPLRSTDLQELIGMANSRTQRERQGSHETHDSPVD